MFVIPSVNIIHTIVNIICDINIIPDYQEISISVVTFIGRQLLLVIIAVTVYSHAWHGVAVCYGGTRGVINVL